MILPELPLLNYLIRTEELARRRPFDGFALLSVQHLLGSTATLLNAIIECGVVSYQSYVVGKAYSTSSQAMAFLSEKGIHVVNALSGYADNLPYDTVLEAHIGRTIDHLVSDYKPNDNRRVLLIDDGGKLIYSIHKEHPKIAPFFHCVEQTSRGVRNLKDLNLACPVVNVARSWVKKRFEAPLIAHSMILELSHLLKEWQDVYCLPNLRMVLIGYGVIGREVCKQFKMAGYEPIVFDRDPSRLEKAIADGNRVTSDLTNSLPGAGLVASCTGEPSLNEDDFNYIGSDSLLVNMGSSDLEFSPWLFRDLGKIIHYKDETGLSEKPKISTPAPWRSLFEIPWLGRHFFLANGGFPVDFSGSLDPIPPREIQITRALLFAGALQAVQTRQKGLIDLNDTIQYRMAVEYQHLNPNPLWGSDSP